MLKMKWCWKRAFIGRTLQCPLIPCLTVQSRSASTSNKSSNVVAALYVDSNGHLHQSSCFDPKSQLSETLKKEIKEFIQDKDMKIKPGLSRTFYWPTQSLPYKSISVAALPSETYPDALIDLKKEQVRQAYGNAIKELQRCEETDVLIDDVVEMMAASEGCHLAAYNFDMYKSSKNKKPDLDLTLLNDDYDDASTATNCLDEWLRGCILADCQNLARTLMEMPSNHMTPAKFAEEVVNVFETFRNDSKVQLEIKIRDEEWLNKQNMRAFLAVGKGSAQKPVLLELHLTHPEAASDETKPLVFVGKGICFDSGGISIKSAAKMGLMRADMGGAACIAATALGMMRLNIRGKVVCLLGLCENMPSSTAYKPGDVVISRSGLSIEVDNTDAEGRVVLADVLDYSNTFNPSTVVDVATLTGAMGVALGAGYTGAFCTTNKTFDLLKKSGSVTGDQFWRMPLSNYYVEQVTNSTLADVINTSKGSAAGKGGSCTAAAFLSQFVKCQQWAHLDIAGVMENSSTDVKYMSAGMSGRPTRSLIQFVQNYFEQH